MQLNGASAHNLSIIAWVSSNLDKFWLLISNFSKISLPPQIAMKREKRCAFASNEARASPCIRNSLRLGSPEVATQSLLA